MMRIIVEVNVSMVVNTDMKSMAKPSVNLRGSETWKFSRSKGDVTMERNITRAVKEHDKETTSVRVKDMKKGEWRRSGKPSFSSLPPGTVKAAANTTVATRTATPEHD